MDKTFSLDAVAPVIYVCNLVGGSCDLIPVSEVHVQIKNIREHATFMFLNNYIVATRDPRIIPAYVDYVIHGVHDVTCAEMMIHNGMGCAIDEGFMITTIVDGWFATERDGIMRLLRHVVSHSTYLAIVARDHLLHTTHRASSHALGEIVDALMTALPYMTFDLPHVDTSDASWERVRARLARTSSTSGLPWPVPNRALME
jgi:hypothetical protein